ncbi:staphylococcus nuclease domain [Gracilibacillus boraciitolerans JCM 21714]|uniref:Staphylococcus nuclease domain n=1 Tax=Gracilibacillus boraciitolerans JCM 21714 TaxID=1298598 RepID=W4VQH7_9BACI|nr:thermonuclease family protein [Gracilibacillus boraciitolerans]GAE95014.1 staphylococcus nuclease domain [Gracilibacillus boraciitolerans JCM 21714]
MFFYKLLTNLLLIFLFLTGCGTITEEPIDDNKNQVIKDEKVEIEDNEENSNAKQVEDKDIKKNFTKAKVNRVVDGDTVNIQVNGKKETVRLLLVDTPETKHPNLPVQPYGPEASDFAVEILAGKEIQIEFDGPMRDHYDRLLGYIWVDGENFNKMLIEEGLARYAYVYDPPYTHQDEMKQAEQQAMEAGIGIWSMEGYVTDDGFHIEKEVPESGTNGNQDGIYFANCSEAHKAGVTPLYEGDPGYGSHMDGDGDGIACE